MPKKLIIDFSAHSVHENFQNKIIKILSWNIMAQKYNKFPELKLNRYDEIMKIIISDEYDFVLLQEVDSEFLKLLSNQSKFHIYNSIVEPYGLVILSKYIMSYDAYTIDKSHKRFLVVYNDYIAISNCHLTASYAKHRERKSQFLFLIDQLSNKYIQQKVKILDGDFNIYDSDPIIETDIAIDLSVKSNLIKPTFLNTNIYNRDDAYNYRFDRFYSISCEINMINATITDTDLSDHCMFEVFININ